MARNRNRIDNILKWLGLIFLIVAPTVTIFMAVSLTPVSGQASTVGAEVLAKQLEFILKMNTAFLALLGIIGALLTWVFKNNLEDARKVVREIVRQELTEHIESIVEKEIQYLKKTLRIEQVIEETFLCYYLAAADSQHPSEYNLLSIRGFDSDFFNETKPPKKNLGDVLVIDISNSPENIDYLQTENDSELQKQAFQKLEELVRTTLEELLQNQPPRRMPVLIVYVRPGKNRIKAIDNLKTNFPAIKYYTSANTPVALMGGAIDSAYVADGDRRDSS